MAGSRTPWCRQSSPSSRQPNPWGESMIIHRNEPGQGLAGTLASLLGGDLPVAIRAYDGSYAGPLDASATLVIRSPDAVRRVLSSLGELGIARLVRGTGGLRRAPEPPAEEIRLHGRRHSRSRDAAAIAHHYDVSGDFYRLILGPAMTYSCAVWELSLIHISEPTRRT